MMEVRRKLHGEGGQSLVEYALILLLAALGAIAGLTLFGNGLLNIYTSIVTQFPAV